MSRMPKQEIWCALQQSIGYATRIMYYMMLLTEAYRQQA